MGLDRRRFGQDIRGNRSLRRWTYDFQVRGKYNDLEGQPTVEATGASAGAAYVPDVPSGVTATPTIGGVVLTWTPPVADESNADESLRTSEPEFYRYQLSTASGT
jgi:hypothetical protein